MTFQADILTAVFALSAALKAASAGHTLVAFVIYKAFSAIRASTIGIFLKVARQAPMISTLATLAAAVIAHTTVTQFCSVTYAGTAAG